MNPFFKNFNHFLPRKIDFFLRNISQNEDILQIFLSFLKNYSKILKFSIFMEPRYKSRDISDDCYYIVEKFIKNLNKIGLDPVGTIGNGMKFLENYAENLL